MPRTGQVKKREISADQIYQSTLVHRLINKIMKDGKKSIAQKIVYQAFEKIRRETGQDPLKVFELALKNTMPLMEVRPRRVGGATYLVPMEVRGDRRYHLGLRFLIEAAQGRESKEYMENRGKNIVMAQKLAAELLEAAKSEGGAVKRKEESHRVAEANRAFAHFRW